MDFGSIFILNLPSYTIIAFNMKIFSIFTLFLLYSTLLNAQTASKDTVKVLSQKDMQAAELKYNEAYILLQSNKNAEAITKFAEAISIKANFPEAYYNRAVAKIASDDLVGCINDLNRVITLKPEPKYFHARGVARFKYKDFSGALEDFGKSIAAGKSTFLHESHYYTGLIYFDQKKNSEAIKSLSAALIKKRTPKPLNPSRLPFKPNLTFCMPCTTELRFILRWATTLMLTPITQVFFVSILNLPVLISITEGSL